MTLSLAPVPLNTARLRLEVLSASHAAKATAAFADARLHEFIGGAPLSHRATAERYARLEAGRSENGAQLWFNWMLFEAGTEATRAVATWLRHAGVVGMRAYVHPRNLASAAVARSLGMARTATIVDGEFLWLVPRADAQGDAGSRPSA